MLIILEGPDGAGKTSLQHSLALASTRRPILQLHCGPMTGTYAEEYIDPLLAYEPCMSDAICDRWHLGELIYGPLYRGKSNVDRFQVREIEEFLNIKKAVLVHVTASIQTLLSRNYDEAPREEFLKREDLGNVVRAYDTMFARSGIKYKIAINTTQSDMNRDSMRVLTLGRRAESE